jgi:hypothetical protein
MYGGVLENEVFLESIYWYIYICNKNLDVFTM